MYEQRKECVTCHEKFISFQGHFLHIEKPCPGITDAIHIEATIQDEAMHDKFLEIYGKPKLDDIDRLEIYEKQLNNPIVRLILKILSFL